MSLSEKKIQGKIINYLRKRNYLCVKLTNVSMRGMPDVLVISEDGKIFFIEVKSEHGKLSPLQSLMVAELQRRGIKVIIAKTLDDVRTDC